MTNNFIVNGVAVSERCDILVLKMLPWLTPALIPKVLTSVILVTLFVTVAVWFSNRKPSSDCQVS